jgi:hypothetical protein
MKCVARGRALAVRALPLYLDVAHLPPRSLGVLVLDHFHQPPVVGNNVAGAELVGLSQLVGVPGGMVEMSREESRAKRDSSGTQTLRHGVGFQREQMRYGSSKHRDRVLQYLDPVVLVVTGL